MIMHCEIFGKYRTTSLSLSHISCTVGSDRAAFQTTIAKVKGLKELALDTVVIDSELLCHPNLSGEPGI